MSTTQIPEKFCLRLENLLLKEHVLHKQHEELQRKMEQIKKVKEDTVRALKQDLHIPEDSDIRINLNDSSVIVLS